MAVPWPTFINTVGSYLNDSSEGKSHEQTAEKIALEYHKVVVSAGTILHANPVLVQAPYVPIKLAIQKSLEDIFNSGVFFMYDFIAFSVSSVEQSFTIIISFWMAFTNSTLLILSRIK